MLLGGSALLLLVAIPFPNGPDFLSSDSLVVDRPTSQPGGYAA